MQTATIGYTKGARNNTVQFFRALAIIAVVMIHTTPLGYWQVFCRPFLNFAVAMFLFLSGYLTKIDNDHWGSFYKRRIVRVIIPYIIWTVLYTLYSRKIGRLPENLLTAKATAHMYYIFVYVQFVLLTPLLGKLATSKYRFLGWFVAPVSLIVFRYYWLLTGHTLNNTVSLLWGDACLGWFTFYYLGLTLGNHIIERHYSIKVLVLLYLISVVLQMAEGYGWLMLGEKNCGTQMKLTAILTSTLFLLIAYTALRSSRFDIKSKILIMIGDYSFGIYLCHVLVMKCLRDYIPLYKSVPYPLTSVVVLLLSLCFCYMVDKVCGERICRWIGIK